MTNSSTNQFLATLQTGSVYSLEGVQYRRNEPRVVDVHTKAYMEEFALSKRKYTENVDGIETVMAEERCIFGFQPLQSDEDVKAAKRAEAAKEKERRGKGNKSPAKLREEAKKEGKAAGTAPEASTAALQRTRTRPDAS